MHDWHAVVVCHPPGRSLLRSCCLPSLSSQRRSRMRPAEAGRPAVSGAICTAAGAGGRMLSNGVIVRHRTPSLTCLRDGVGASSERAVAGCCATAATARHSSAMHPVLLRRPAIESSHGSVAMKIPLLCAVCTWIRHDSLSLHVLGPPYYHRRCTSASSCGCQPVGALSLQRPISDCRRVPVLGHKSFNMHHASSAQGVGASSGLVIPSQP